MKDLSALPYSLEADYSDMLKMGDPTKGDKMKAQINSIEDLDDLPTIGDKMKTISIKDGNGKEYVFEKPEFECKLLGIERDLVFGWVKDDGGYLFASSWILNNGFENDNKSAQYDLAPIKPKWYEDESNFPAMCVWENSRGGDGLYIFGSYYDGYFTDSDGETHPAALYRLATKEELNSLYYEGK